MWGRSGMCPPLPKFILFLIWRSGQKGRGKKAGEIWIFLFCWWGHHFGKVWPPDIFMEITPLQSKQMCNWASSCRVWWHHVCLFRLSVRFIYVWSPVLEQEHRFRRQTGQNCRICEHGSRQTKQFNHSRHLIKIICMTWRGCLYFF